jgi:hypothetical protein
MAFCSHCGTQLPEGADFCPACGRPVHEEGDAGTPPSGHGPPAPPDSGYPVAFDVDYPDRPLNRVSTFFRVFAAIPIVILLGLLSGRPSPQPGAGCSSSPCC